MFKTKRRLIIYEQKGQKNGEDRRHMTAILGTIIIMAIMFIVGSEYGAFVTPVVFPGPLYFIGSEIVYDHYWNKAYEDEEA